MNGVTKQRICLTNLCILYGLYSDLELKFKFKLGVETVKSNNSKPCAY
jgi:hypothetical protein